MISEEPRDYYSLGKRNDVRENAKRLRRQYLRYKDNNTVFNLCCSLCTAYEHKAFVDGLQYGAHLISELHR